jgi:hypothetical protein
MLDQSTSYRYHAVVSLRPMQTELMADGSRQQLINVTLHDGQMLRPVVAGIRPDDARALAAQLGAFADSAIRSPVEPAAYDDALDEALNRFPAYSLLHGFLVADGRPETAVLVTDPREVAAGIREMGTLRASALLLAHCHGRSIVEATNLVEHLFNTASGGQRPRCGAELGLRLGFPAADEGAAGEAMGVDPLSPDEQRSIARVRSSLDAEIERDVAGVNGIWLEWRAALDDLTEPAA